MSPEELISENAIKFVKSHKKELIEKFAGTVQQAKGKPYSFFMAGSPGAGKTEFSKRLIPSFEKGGIDQILRIDADDIRVFLPGYTGNNSKLFQGAISVAVAKLYDHALEKKTNFLLDGTFSNLRIAQENIQRSIDHGRMVVVFYIFLDPKTAWDLTSKREALEGRNIPKEAFVSHLFNSYGTVKLVKEQFGDQVTLFLVDKKSINIADFTITEVKNTLTDYKIMTYNQDTLLKTL